MVSTAGVAATPGLDQNAGRRRRRRRRRPGPGRGRQPPRGARPRRPAPLAPPQGSPHCAIFSLRPKYIGFDLLLLGSYRSRCVSRVVESDLATLGFEIDFFFISADVPGRSVLETVRLSSACAGAGPDAGNGGRRRQGGAGRRRRSDAAPAAPAAGLEDVRHLPGRDARRRPAQTHLVSLSAVPVVHRGFFFFKPVSSTSCRLVASKDGANSTLNQGTNPLVLWPLVGACLRKKLTIPSMKPRGCFWCSISFQLVASKPTLR